MRVYLYPNTKQSSHLVHRQCQVVVGKDPKAHWPLVLVTWNDGVDRWELVHRDNISKKPIAPPQSADKKSGDQIGADDHRPASVRTMGSPIVNLDGQDVLF